MPSRAYDIGCAVGRSSFELARHFQEVIGLDYSQNFVDTCEKLKNDGELPYFIQDEGDLVTDLIARVPKDVVKLFTRLCVFFCISICIEYLI